MDIGIAAIDCGADAVYIAGPAFGARQAAGNSLEDIRSLTEYAHRFGVRIFLTLNTILFDNELAGAERLLAGAKAAGVDAIIAQDLAVWRLTDLPVHASTQCAIRTPEKARLYESIGASRLVLEREMSLGQIKAVREAVGCELEFFVHGALCVCYSGQCYMSERIAGRSANRGECIQACRSLYDLVDGSGNVLVRNKALLSLKDYNLKDRLKDLAEAGICSFKIEGRLKNISYVRNTVRAYSSALDELVAANPEKFSRTSFGRPEGGFTPDLGKTFNRGYTQLFLDGRRSGNWSSMDAPKSIGEEVGTVVSIEKSTITVRMKNPSERLQNGDGFSFLAKGRGEIVGFRGDVCQWNRITCRNVVQGLYPGARLYRNLSNAFERELDSNPPVRRIPVAVDISVRVAPATQTYSLRINAVSQDGRSVDLERMVGDSAAENPERMRGMFSAQISKATGRYSFTLRSLDVETPDGSLPFLPASTLNSIRRDVAAALEEIPCKAIPLPANQSHFEFSKAIGSGKSTENSPANLTECRNVTEDLKSSLCQVSDIQQQTSEGIHLSYKANIANHIAREAYQALGATRTDEAFEISHIPEAELMRTKYCIRHELGLCPARQKTDDRKVATPPNALHVSGRTTRQTDRLCLTNNGKRYLLCFDCANCEMVVKSVRG